MGLHAQKFPEDQPPDWAKVENVLGYTSEEKLSAPDVENLTKPQPNDTKFPSVYYSGGHRTLKHKKGWNVGWEGTNREWLFFGNVLEDWLERNYWDANKEKSVLTDDTLRKKCANLLLQAASTGNLASAPQSSATHLRAAARALPASAPQVHGKAPALSSASTPQTSAPALICTSYFNNKSFGNKICSELPDDKEVRLLEIFYDGNPRLLFDHPARHRFWWAAGEKDGGLRRMLHTLARQGAKFI